MAFMAIATPRSILRDEIPTSTKNILGSACEAHRAVSVTLHWLVLRAPYSRGPPSRPLCLLPAMRRPVFCESSTHREWAFSLCT